jgi:hypothetical protein
LILYSTVAIVTGLMIGYVSLAVGYIVGHAIKKGSGGRGGRRYQIAALALTYFAVSMSAIPIMIAQQIKEKPVQTEQSSSPKNDEAPSVGKGLVILLLYGLASPFLELSSPFSGLLGLVILFVGLRIAWQTTAGVALAIDGPFGN